MENQLRLNMNSFKAEEVAAMIGMMSAGVSDTGNEIHDLVEAYFVSPVDDDDDDDESDDDEDKDEEVYPDKALDADGLGTNDIPVPMDTSSSDEASDDDMDEEPVDRPPVLVQPTRPNGEGNLPIQHQDQILAHPLTEPDEERERIEQFTCTCKHYNEGPCSSRYSTDQFIASRWNMMELTTGKNGCVHV